MNFYTIQIETGTYELTNIDTIFQKMKANGHYETVNDKSYVRIYGTSNTLKAIMELESGYVVDSMPDNSLRTILGFNAQTYNSPYNESPNPVNILIELKIED